LKMQKNVTNRCIQRPRGVTESLKTMCGLERDARGTSSYVVEGGTKKTKGWKKSKIGRDTTEL